MDINITIRQVEQVDVVELDGEINTTTAPSIKEQILPLAKSEDSKLLLNMTKVSFMSSAGLRMLLTLYRQTVATGGKILLVGLSEDIEDTMSVTGFLDFFEISDSVESGLSALQS